MEENLSKSYSEINNILDILGDEYKNRLPKKLIKFFKDNAEKEYDPGITEDDFVNGRFLESTRALIAILYINYWSQKDEKAEYMDTLRKKDEEYNEKHKVVIKEIFPNQEEMKAEMEKPAVSNKGMTDKKSNSNIIADLLVKLKSIFSK